LRERIHPDLAYFQDFAGLAFFCDEIFSAYRFRRSPKVFRSASDRSMNTPVHLGLGTPRPSFIGGLDIETARQRQPLASLSLRFPALSSLPNRRHANASPSEQWQICGKPPDSGEDRSRMRRMFDREAC
jgi:hypothetical protein